MTWNHRIIYHDEDGPGNEYYAVHECYYSRRGAKMPHSWTESPIKIMENDIADMKRILKACDQPILKIKGNKLVKVKT